MSVAFELRVEPGAVSARLRTLPFVGNAAYVLAVALVIVALAATGLSLLYPSALRGPAVTNGQLQGTALVLLVVTLPILIVSVVLARRGMLLPVVFWLGALGSIAYQAVLFLFATPFNSFFFLYVGLLSLSIWTLVTLWSGLDIAAIGDRVGRHAPRRIVAGYVLVNAALFLVLWLQATVPAVLDGSTPEFLEGTGMTTGPVQIMDLAFTLPLMTLASVLLLRGTALGSVLTGALLVMLAIESASIGVDQWLGHLADPASPAASAALTPVFAALTVVGVVVLGLFLRPAPRRPAREGPASR